MTPPDVMFLNTETTITHENGFVNVILKIFLLFFYLFFNFFWEGLSVQMDIVQKSEINNKTPRFFAGSLWQV